jgi:glucan biosynthesis protein
MIFKIQTMAQPLLRGLLLTLIFGSLNVSAATDNVSFNIDNVASLAKQLAAESFKPPQSIPDFLKQLSYNDYIDIRFDPEQSLWKDNGGNFQIQLPCRQAMAAVPDSGRACTATSD